MIVLCLADPHNDDYSYKLHMLSCQNCLRPSTLTQTPFLTHDCPSAASSPWTHALPVTVLHRLAKVAAESANAEK